MSAPRPLTIRWLGQVPYGRALALQESLVVARRNDEVQDTLLLLEHPPVITLGRGSRPEHVVADPSELARRGIELHECGRGGDVTYHGPGQLIGYPVLSLETGRRDAHRYLRDLEETLIRTAADYGIRAVRVPGLTGVWVGEAKLAAIGVRLSTGWITSHGFAFNVSDDLSGFSTIVPCGISGRGVASLAGLLGREIPLQQVAGRVASHLARVFGRQPVQSDDRAGRPAAEGPPARAGAR